ncbi:MAG: AraC family transcriptional regulator [Spirochaetes bacterium]|nr:MAG: AraC family transcriptional regulator [Spirochaetota bacterium]
MTGFQVTLSVVIVAGVVLTAFIALEHITGRRKERHSWFRFARGLIVSILIAQMAAVGLGLYRAHPRVLFLFLTLLYLISPLEYIRNYMFLHPGRAIPAYLRLPLLPAVPLFFLELWIYTKPLDAQRALAGAFFGDPLNHPMIWVFLGCLLVTVLYMVMLLWMQIAALRENAAGAPLRFSIALTVITLVSVALSCVYIVDRDGDFMLMGAAGISLTVILYFLFKNRFPDFFQLLAAGMKSNRYRKALAKGLDHRAIHERLLDLMRDERLYTDMDLRLNDVAARLLIRPHQLSQILNEQGKTDFRNYVNRFRIDEAKRLLADTPDRSVISICFEVGFNSKTSFNITFRKMTGLSPRAYREKAAR